MQNMSETVYLLGAGVNRHIDWHGLWPPLVDDFFRMALRSEKFNNEHYFERIARVYDYIRDVWKKNRSDLENEPFNLEDCFTMIQLEQAEAEREGDHNEYGRLAGVEFLLVSFLAEYLSEFEVAAITSDIMREFGTVLYREEPSILTVNYDCIIESIIESASGVNSNIPGSFKEGGVADDELPYSHMNWNRPLSYAIKFDQVQLQRAGLPTYVDGDRFYSHPANRLYSWKLLKLHGSLNWFRYVPIRKYHSLDASELKLPEERLREVLLINGRWWFTEPPDFQGWLLEPMIITPVLYKEHYYQNMPFPDIWREAREELSRCKRLVIIGYSFAAGDFSIRKLLLDAFREDHLRELVVVNPDTSVVKKAKELSHFDKPVLVCSSLEEYLKLNTA